MSSAAKSCCLRVPGSSLGQQIGIAFANISPRFSPSVPILLWSPSPPACLHRCPLRPNPTSPRCPARPQVEFCVTAEGGDASSGHLQGLRGLDHAVYYRYVISFLRWGTLLSLFLGMQMNARKYSDGSNSSGAGWRPQLAAVYGGGRLGCMAGGV